MAFDRTLGLFIRNARVARGLSQHRAAAKAGVSRRQFVFLEQGGNVSIEFLAKVCQALDLREVPVAGGTVNVVRTPAVGDAMQIIATADVLAQHAELLRSLAIALVLPSTERAVGDAAAIGEFFAGHSELTPDDADRVNRALRRLAADIARTPGAAAEPAKPTRKRVRREE